MSRLLRLVLPAAACAATVSSALAATVSDGEVMRPEGQRHFLLATPAQRTPGKHPLVILLHGHMGSGSQVLGRTRWPSPMQLWLDIADREQLVLIAPDGVKGGDDKPGWNDCRSDTSTNPKVDDVSFIGALVDKAVAQYDADPRRVYVMGMSNGGGMAYRLATEMAPRLAAFAVVSAPSAAQSLCPTPRQPLPALIVHGTDDPIVPYGGGALGKATRHQRGTSGGAEQAAAFWRQLDGVADTPAVMAFPHHDVSGPTSATRSVWGTDPARLQVEFIRVEHGGHAEPSSAYRMPRVYTMLVGKQNGDFEVADEAWQFFKDKRAAR
jgi:polyhydroxybutyrate depolymerase